MLLAAALAVASCGGGPSTSQDGELVVFAAASLAEALPDAVAVCTESEPVFSFAGSNVLARQIESAGAADLFLSADDVWMDRLEELRRVLPESRRDLLANELVVVVRQDDPATAASPTDLLGLFDASQERRLVLADPEAVPAGRYTKQFLENASLWGKLESRLAPTLDVRAALHLVEALPGAVGVVYRTDLEASDEVRVLFTVPAELAPDIRYAAAVVAGSKSPEQARDLLDCLAGRETGRVFERHGFLPIGG